MSVDKKKSVSVHPSATSDTSTSSAFSLRMPSQLRVNADLYAEATGVSLNGLICIALADYLASRGHHVKV